MSECAYVIRKRRRRPFSEKSRRKYKIRVRYRYHSYARVEVEDYGTFAEMFAKYGGRYTYWCADLPPTVDSDGNWTGYRLDAYRLEADNLEAALKRYGKRKAWIDPTYKYMGKQVVLVYNAGRYRERRRKGPGGGYIVNPKMPKAGRKKGSSDNQPKSPLLRHFFFWTVVLSMFMGIFGGFPAQIQSIVLWNDIYTLFGAISYWDATISWLVTIVVVACIDMVLVS